MAALQPLIGRPLNAPTRGADHRALWAGRFRDDRLLGGHRGQGADEQTGIEIHARRKSWGPNYLRFGLNLQDDFQGNSRTTRPTRFLVTEINPLGAEWRTDLQIGNNPLGDQRVLPAADRPHDSGSSRRACASRRPTCRSTSMTPQIADFRERQTEGDLDFGRDLGDWGELRVGYHRINGAARERYGNPGLVDRAFQQRRIFLQVQRTTGWTTSIFRGRARPSRCNGTPTGSTRLGRRLRPRDRRLARGLLARPQYADAVDLGRHHAGRHIEPTASAGLLFAGRFPEPVGPRAAVADRSELCHRAGDLPAQDRPRRRGLLRISRLSRHVARGRQHLAAARRHQLELGAQGCVAVPRIRHAARAAVLRQRLRRAPATRRYFLFLGQRRF